MIGARIPQQPDLSLFWVDDRNKGYAIFGLTWCFGLHLAGARVTSSGPFGFSINELSMPSYLREHVIWARRLRDYVLRPVATLYPQQR
jgi:hypothetical protein